MTQTLELQVLIPVDIETVQRILENLALEGCRMY